MTEKWASRASLSWHDRLVLCLSLLEAWPVPFWVSEARQGPAEAELEHALGRDIRAVALPQVLRTAVPIALDRCKINSGLSHLSSTEACCHISSAFFFTVFSILKQMFHRYLGSRERERKKKAERACVCWISPAPVVELQWILWIVWGLMEFDGAVRGSL